MNHRGKLTRAELVQQMMGMLFGLRCG